MEMQKFFDEVKNLHAVIQDWMTGSVPKTEAAFSLFRNALDTEFVIIHPTGVAERYEEILKSFWSAHGIQDKNFVIEIQNLNHRITFDNFSLVTYEEWQFGTAPTARFSSVLFKNTKKDNRVRWIHLHETWMEVKYENTTTG